MDRLRCGPLLCVISLLALSVFATAQDSQVKRRLTPKEIEALPGESAGAGTSGLPAVTTRVLFGDPTKSGLYTIELKVAPNTVIRDWNFARAWLRRELSGAGMSDSGTMATD